MNNATHCADCGAEFKAQGCTTGYGTTPDGVRHCFECCAKHDRADMIETGRAVLYLTKRDGVEIINWPNTLRFRPRSVWTGRHNFARTRTDAEFIGPDGYVWRATQYGEHNEIAHCRRTKIRA